MNGLSSSYGCYFKLGWRREGLIVCALESESSGLAWDPAEVIVRCCVLRKTASLSQLPLTQVYKWDHHSIWGSNRNSPCRSMLEKSG